MTNPDNDCGSHRGRIYSYQRIKELWKRRIPIPDVVSYHGDRSRLVVRNQLVVQLDSPLLNHEFALEGNDIRKNTPRRQVKVKIIGVCHCNPGLVLLEGTRGAKAHLLTGDMLIRYSPETDQPPPQVKSSSANDVRYSPETDQPPPQVKTSSDGSGVPIDIVPASFDYQLRRILAGSASWSEFPIVAVMDTGIDFAYPNVEAIPIQHNGGHSMCGSIEPDYIGWDFVNDQNNPYDDNETNKHGTRIAAIISSKMQHKVRILPLKVIDSHGFGLLFNIFCGLEYVLSSRLREKPSVVNASWGFYSETENSLLTHYIKRLESNKIWLINAAGNRGDIHRGQTVDLSLKPNTRFPACYTTRHANVITVTTVNQNQSVRTGFEVTENYSSTFVNIGVGSGNDGMFQEPLVTDRTRPPIKGSSYATPYVSAFIAEGKRLPSDQLTRNELLQAIPGETKINALGAFIANGLIVPVE